MLGRQWQLDPKLYNIEKQQFGLESQSLGMQRALEARQRQDLMRNYYTAKRQNISGQAASGTMFTSGAREQLSNMRQDLSTALQQNTVQTRQTALQQKGLGLTEQQAGLQFNEQMQALRDQWKNLDILAQRYGISAQELSARLQNTIANIKYGAAQNVNLDWAGALQGSSQMMQALMSAGAPPLGAFVGGVGGP